MKSSACHVRLSGWSARRIRRSSFSLEDRPVSRSWKKNSPFIFTIDIFNSIQYLFCHESFFFFRNYPQFCSTTCLQWCSGILALSSSLPKETNALVLQSFSLSSSKQISFQSFNAHANITGDAIALGLSQISNWLSRVSSAIFNRTEFWESKACSVLLINMMFEKKKKKNFEKRCSYS